MRNAVQVDVAELKSEIWICLMLSLLFVWKYWQSLQSSGWLANVTSLGENIQVKFKATISSFFVTGKKSDVKCKRKSLLVEIVTLLTPHGVTRTACGEKKKKKRVPVSLSNLQSGTVNAEGA